MKTPLWIAIIVLMSFIGFLIGYSVAPREVVTAGRGASGYEAEGGGYGAPSGGYGAPSGGYGAPSGGYGAPSGGYGQ